MGSVTFHAVSTTASTNVPAWQETYTLLFFSILTDFGIFCWNTSGPLKVNLLLSLAEDILQTPEQNDLSILRMGTAAFLTSCLEEFMDLVSVCQGSD